MKTKEHIRDALGVSPATISNWIKTGLMPDYADGKRGYSQSTYENILSHIKSTNKLKKRVNRTFNKEIQIVSGTLSYSESKLLVEWLASLLERHKLDVPELMLSISLKALLEKELIELDWDSAKVRSENAEFTSFLQEWMDEVKLSKIAALYQDLVGLKIPETEPDFMGVVYESMRTVGEKSRLGAFFTPPFLVEDLDIPTDKSVLDPCSGTGTILLHVLKHKHQPELITLRDIDALALRVAKVNFVLFFNRIDQLIRTESINILAEQEEEYFDYIITNPPWGARLDRKTKKELVKAYPELKTSESFSITLFNALKKLDFGSRLIFILPESLLYVDAHENMRQLLFNGQYQAHIRHYGKAFKGVMSKVIRLELQRGDFELQVSKENEHFVIPQALLQANNYRPPAVNAAGELKVLEKIFASNFFTLEDRCTFGLGIVTGNNKAHLKPERFDKSEPIYTGKDLQPFRFDDPSRFIHFQPEKLQQVAPIKFYRQPKLCYRFISNKLTIVADFKGSLMLNSINFFIPEKELSIKALCAFFNSPIATFLYQRLFNSIKVLRTHLEHLPIPENFMDYDKELTELYEKAVHREKYQEQLHHLCCTMFGLSVKEMDLVRDASKPV